MIFSVTDKPDNSDITFSATAGTTYNVITAELVDNAWCFIKSPKVR